MHLDHPALQYLYPVSNALILFLVRQSVQIHRMGFSIFQQSYVIPRGSSADDSIPRGPVSQLESVRTLVVVGGNVRCDVFKVWMACTIALAVPNARL